MSEVFTTIDDEDIDYATSGNTGEGGDSDGTVFVDPTVDDSRPPGIGVDIVLTTPAIRGECRVPGCGPAADGRSYYCKNHLPPKFLYENKGLRNPRGGDGPVDPVREAKREHSKKVAKYKKFILEQNPMLVQGAQMLCSIPEEWLDREDVIVMEQQLPDGTTQTIRFWSPTLRTQFEFTNKQADILANSVVSFEQSATGQKLVAVMTVFMPWMYMAGAVGVLGIHAIKVAMLRKSVEQAKGIMQQQMQFMMQQAAAAQSGMSPEDFMAQATAAAGGITPDMPMAQATAATGGITPDMPMAQAG